MAVEKIPIFLDLRSAKALRDALGLEKAVGKVGDSAEDAGKKGADGFDSFSKSALGTFSTITGIGVGLAGVVGLMKEVLELQNRINIATAEAIRQNQDRQRSAAEILKSPALEKLRQLLGGTLQERFQEASERAAQFGGLDVQEVIKAQLNRIPRLSVAEAKADPGARRALETDLTFAVGAAVKPTTAVQLSSVIGERFPNENRKQALAEVLAGAEQSASTPEQISQILTESAVSLKQAGLSTVGAQVPVIAGLAQFFPPEQTEKTTTLAKQLSATLLDKDPFTTRQLRRKGIDPDRATIGDVLGIWSDFINQGKTQEDRNARGVQLAGLTGIPQRVFRGILSASQKSFGEVKNKAAVAIEGANFSNVEAAAEGVIQAPESRLLAAGVRQRAGQTAVGAIPGSAAESVRILSELTGGVGAGTPEITENLRLGFARDSRLSAGILKDDPITEEESREAFDLISVWKGSVEPALTIIMFANPRRHSLPNTIQGRAEGLIGKGNFLAGQVGKAQIKLPGLPNVSQKDFIAQLKAHIVTSIQFIRLLQTGRGVPEGFNQTIDITSEGGPLEGAMLPTGPESSAAAGFNPAPVLPGGNTTNIISVQNNVFDRQDPAEATPEKLNRGTGPVQDETP